MTKRKSFRSLLPLLLATAMVFVSSCNRGVGCPANNMSSDSFLDRAFDLLVHFAVTIANIIL